MRVPPVSGRGPASTPAPVNRVRWLAERILYEDGRILILDKPAGMPVHAGSGVDFGCIEALRSLAPSLRKADLIHRLDRGTSGCLMVARRRSTLRQMHALLRAGGVDKRYLALVRGYWPHGRYEADASLRTHRRRGENLVQVDPAGKSALSRFRVVEHYGTRATLMEVAIDTGRTHQIRVHAAHAGHPVAGDERYGGREFNAAMSSLGLKRMFLHAHALTFVWPGGEEVFAVSAPLPRELSTILDTLESSRRDRRDQGDRGRSP